MKEAMQLLLSLGAEAASTVNKQLPKELAGKFVAVPKGVELESLESSSPHRYRAKGQFDTHLTEHFIAYIKTIGPGVTPASAPIFINSEKMTAKCIFNYTDAAGTSGAGHCDHTALLTLNETDTYKAIRRALDNNSHSQRNLMNLLEDYSEEIKALDAANAEIDTAQAIKTIGNIHVKKTTDAKSSEQDYAGERSFAEQIALQDSEKMPARLRITVQTHHGMSPQTFEARLGYINDDNRFEITTRLLRHEKVAENVADELAKKLSELANPIYHGSR